MRQYISYKEGMLTGENIDEFCKKHGFDGTEVFMDDIVSRNLPLFNNNKEKEILKKRLEKLNVKRLHCSYWAYPTSFLTKNDFSQLIERFGDEKEVKAYYGDLTGRHMFRRWIQEYEMACELKAQAYTFHLIDYAPIDGEWAFTISREDICQAMIFMTQQFICLLEEREMLTESSPQIELENAGWALEYGVQTSLDYKRLFNQLYDPHGKVRIGWDINHLLHAIGGEAGKIRFMLPMYELDANMKRIKAEYESCPQKFIMEWIKTNLLEPDIIEKIGAIQLSDCALKGTEYFTAGKLNEPFMGEISKLHTWEEKENYGVGIVLSKYDSHLPLGTGVLSGKEMGKLLEMLEDQNPELVILHELKNSSALQSDLDMQLTAIWG